MYNIYIYIYILKRKSGMNDHLIKPFDVRISGICFFFHGGFEFELKSGYYWAQMKKNLRTPIRILMGVRPFFSILSIFKPSPGVPGAPRAPRDSKNLFKPIY